MERFPWGKYNANRTQVISSVVKINRKYFAISSRYSIIVLNLLLLQTFLVTGEGCSLFSRSITARPPAESNVNVLLLSDFLREIYLLMRLQASYQRGWTLLDLEFSQAEVDTNTIHIFKFLNSSFLGRNQLKKLLPGVFKYNTQLKLL